MDLADTHRVEGMVFEARRLTVEAHRLYEGQLSHDRSDAQIARTSQEITARCALAERLLALAEWSQNS